MAAMRSTFLWSLLMKPVSLLEPVQGLASVVLVVDLDLKA
jgi:hypothetical protein